MKLRIHRAILYIKFIFVIIGTFHVNTDSYAFDTQIVIYGTTYIPPCSINENIPINISLGRISPVELTPASIEIPVHCSYFGPKVYVRITGSPLPQGESHTLTTSLTGLGVSLYQGRKVDSNFKIALGSKTAIDGGLHEVNGGSKFNLTIMPVMLVEDVNGDFESSAFMEIWYE